MAMHGVWADHQTLGNLGVAEALRDKPEHLSLARAELIQHVGIRLAHRDVRCLDANKRGDGAQDGVTVAMPRQVGVTRQRHELGARQKRGYLAGAPQPHRTVVLTMHDQRRRTHPRQVVAHVGLVD